MPKLDSESRNILEFRPDIEFIEPLVLPTAIKNVLPDLTEKDIEHKITQVENLANSVNILATAIQNRADIRAKDMIIKLDPIVDATTIASMKRMFPDQDSSQITYDQYRDCKDKQIAIGETAADKALVTQDDLEQARQEQGTDAANINAKGGYGTEFANTGGLRPEMSQRFSVLPPVNIPEIQDVLIRILVNFIWKNFIKKTLTSKPGPVAVAAKLLPDEIAPLPNGFQVGDIIDMGTPVLGEKLPKYMTDKVKIPKNLAEAQSQKKAEEEQS